MTSIRPIALILLSLSVAPAAAQNESTDKKAPQSQPAAPSLDEALARFILKSDDKAFQDVARALRTAGKSGRVRIGELHTRVMDTAKPILDAAKSDKSEAKVPDDAPAWLEALVATDAAKATEASGKLKAAGKDVAAPTKKVADRVDALYKNYLRGFVLANLQTGAQFAGQYGDLKDLGPAAIKVFVKWAADAPQGLQQMSDSFRQCSIRALRDVVGTKADKDVVDALKKIASDEFEEPGVIDNAVCALAQFGERSLLDEKLKKLNDNTKAASGQTQYDAWKSLADVHNLCYDYKTALEAYKHMFELLEGDKAKEQQGLSTVYYNAACASSRANMVDEAYALLEKSIATSKKANQQVNVQLYMIDMDIENVRKDPRWAEFTAKHFPKRSEKPEKPVGGDAASKEKAEASAEKK